MLIQCNQSLEQDMSSKVQESAVNVQVIRQMGLDPLENHIRAAKCSKGVLACLLSHQGRQGSMYCSMPFSYLWQSPNG